MTTAAYVTSGSVRFQPPQADPSSYVISFGKHAGRRVVDLPTHYLEWLIKTFGADPAKAQMMAAIRTVMTPGRVETLLRETAVLGGTGAVIKTTLGCVVPPRGNGRIWTLTAPDSREAELHARGWTKGWGRWTTGDDALAWREWQNADASARLALDRLYGDMPSGHPAPYMTMMTSDGSALPVLIGLSGADAPPGGILKGSNAWSVPELSAAVGDHCRARKVVVGKSVREFVEKTKIATSTTMTYVNGDFLLSLPANPSDRMREFLERCGFVDRGGQTWGAKSPIAAWRFWRMGDNGAQDVLEGLFGVAQRPRMSERGFEARAALLYDRQAGRFHVVPAVPWTGERGDTPDLDGCVEDLTGYGCTLTGPTVAKRLLKQVRRKAKHSTSPLGTIHVAATTEILLSGRGFFSVLTPQEVAVTFDAEEGDGNMEEVEEDFDNEDTATSKRRTLIRYDQARGFRLGRATLEFQRVLTLRSLCDVEAEIEVERRLLDEHLPTLLLPANDDLPDPEIVVPCPAGQAYMPYQIEAIRFLASRRRAICADEMGVGKTISALGTVNLLRPRRTLIVCPATVKPNWLREAQTWLVNMSVALAGDRDTGASVVICTFDGVRQWITEVEWDLMILDEAHLVKNSTTKRWRVISALHFDRAILLSGTPIYNRPQDLWTLLHLVCQQAYPDKTLFARHFSVTKLEKAVNGKGHRMENLSLLAPLLRERLMIRRLKADVMADLPPKTRDIALIELPKAAMDALIDRERDVEARLIAVNDLQGNEKTQARALTLGMLARLRRDLGLAKIPHVVDRLLEVAQTDDEPFVVFCHHKEVGQRIAEALDEAGIAVTFLSGDMTATARQAEVDRFQAGLLRVLVCTLSSCGVGLTMTRSSRVFMVELDWTPSVLHQGEDRCHRKGTRDAVSVWYFVVDGTLDGTMGAKVDLKGVVGATALGDMIGANDDGEALAALDAA